MLVFNCPYPGGATTDPYWANVVLLVGAEGVDDSSIFIDESANGWPLSTNGSTQISTEQYRFGSSSMYQNATDGSSNDALVVGSSGTALSNLGAEFTIEAWGRMEALPSFWTVASVYVSTTSQRGWYFGYSSSTYRFVFYDTGGTQRIISTSFAFSTGQWYHLAVDRDASGVVRLYVDGAMVGSATSSQTIRETSATPKVGSLGGFSNVMFQGWLDEVRITKNVARYASDDGFDLPTAAFPRTGP